MSELENFEFDDLTKNNNPYFLASNQNGLNVRKLSLGNLIWGALNTRTSAVVHRNTCRGMNLGSAVTDEQWDEIKVGTFNNMFVGDYWEIGGNRWRIVDFDYWMDLGDTPCTTHHVVIMPDIILFNRMLRNTNTTEGGYQAIRSSDLLNDATNIVKAAFSDHILSYRATYINAVTNGIPSGMAWYDAYVELPNEIMMGGYFTFVPASTGANSHPFRYTIDKAQLALMRIYPRFICSYRRNFWLRDVTSSLAYSYVGSLGDFSNSVPTKEYGIRPVFGIKA